MSSDYEFSDDDNEFFDDEDMFDATQDDGSSDEMDMDADGDDFKITPKNKRKSYEIEYHSLSQSEVEKQMREEVNYICNILGVEPSTASLLLRSMSWNRERLIEKYMDNPSTVLTAAGITLPEPPSSPLQNPIRTHAASGSSSSSTVRRTTRSASKLLGLGSSSKSSPTTRTSPIVQHTTPKYTKFTTKPDEPFVCPICFDDAPNLVTLSLDCGQTFCINCWNMYIVSKIRDEGEIAIRCMAEGCQLIAPDPFIHDVLFPTPPADASAMSVNPQDNAQAWSRFQELLARHFVGSKKDLKYCPYPGCTNTVSCPAGASKFSLTTVVPTVFCGARGIPGQENSDSSLGLGGREHKFCFGCAVEDDHRPVVCSVAKMWLRKCRDDSETANWIKSNTKECSNCQSTIEKNGGCNHMTCKKCKHEFCWVCMGPWSEHGTAWYTCNRYDEKAGVEARDAQSRSRASLERYLHYYNRWANHEQSAKLSRDLYAKTEKKMEDMQITSSLTWIEVQFMKKAVEEVEKCRMTLKWTYAMAYYLARGNEKDLFEDNQRDLEKAVEDLSELLESPIEAEVIPSLRQKVTDKAVYVQKRNEIVLEDTANGFLEGRWRWNVTVEGFDEPDKSELVL
ncbi:hypothetical protein AMATHDRAFT_64008 [Amanita thiersii Skay4041]|uniref:RBR-type E3 ubiquitin transferase n=1 Tax=Amanita thiersii Skay4041 TaxID=703135 RepID=A0A2A9NEG5_9AGAR|nr:hypothetical protein AMATHDRAFT_64008 [Amanita thiersii Skay4041]